MIQQFTAFDGSHRVAQGSLAEVALALHDRPTGQVLIFDDTNGWQTDLDPRLLVPAQAKPASPGRDGARSHAHAAALGVAGTPAWRSLGNTA